jgi:hypothetical protein
MFKLDVRTRWLMTQPTWWLGLIMNTCLAAIAAGLVPSSGITPRIISGFIALCNQYGINKAHLTPPPRIPLAQMSEEDREQAFKDAEARGFADLRPRFYAEHPELNPNRLPPQSPPPIKPGP